MKPQIDTIQGSDSKFPLRESDFYNQIKTSTETGDRSSFALLMSMLTQDALELDEFHVPQRQQEQYLDDLKKQFFIQEKPLIKKSDENRSIQLNEYIQQGLKTTVELDLVLNPEGLVQPSGKIPQEVLDNLNPNVLARYKESEQTSEPKVEVTKSSSNEIDVESWFNVLSESRLFSAAA